MTIPVRRTPLPVTRRPTHQAALRADFHRLTSFPMPVPSEPVDGPYLDYSRTLTNEGGVRIIFKDLDLRWRFTIWRVLAWCMASGCEGYWLYNFSPLQIHWLDGLLFLAVGGLNWLIVRKSVEVYRNFEIRPDCLILEGAEVFWLEKMQGKWPELYPDTEGNYVLSGIYGTRFVEYAILRRFDDFDRMPEVFAEHIEQAMQQLWGRQNVNRSGRG
jgi:hypothetical protein